MSEARDETVSSNDDGQLIPRIAIPQWDDARTVATALVHYAHMMSSTAMRTGDLEITVPEMRIAAELLECILAERQRVREEETEKTFAEFLQKWVEDLGSETSE